MVGVGNCRRLLWLWAGRRGSQGGCLPGRCGASNAGRGRSGRVLVERTGAELAHPAARTRATRPHLVEEALHVVEQQVVVREEADLEIAPAVALGAEPRPRPIGAAEIDPGAVDHHGLEVHPGT